MIKFVVSGPVFSEFPLDMLRHDQAFPYAANDAAHIGAMLIDNPPMEFLRSIAINGKVVITLGTASIRNVTPGRWGSFGWDVVEIDGAKR